MRLSGVLTFPCAVDGEIRVHVGESVVGRVSVTTASLSRAVDGLERGPGTEGLETGTGRVGLLELLDGGVEVRVTRLQGLEGLRGLFEQTLELECGVTESNGLSDESMNVAGGWGNR